VESTRNPQQTSELERYEALLDRAERVRPSGMRFTELRALGVLYRRHLAYLARLQQRGDDPDAALHLNALGVRAYTLLYGTRSRRRAQPRDGRRLLAAAGRGWAPLRIAFALLAIGAFLGAALTSRDSQFLWTIMPSAMGYTPVMLEDLAESEQARERFLERAELNTGSQVFFGSSLFAHNTRVGLLALAAGMLAGIPTVLLTLYNGLVLGAFGSIFWRGDWTLEFLAWILPHGVPEFTAISLCAAGGLLLGAAVTAPGASTRRRALREAMDAALILFAAAVPLLLLAALMESFVRESTLSTSTRLAIATAEIALLVLGAWFLRRFERHQSPGAGWLAELRQADS
jgi:uncharacterized membrane protein SpoIIM required for sporulation